MRFVPFLIICLAAVLGFTQAFGADVPPIDPPINLAMFFPMIAAIAGIIPGALRSFTKDTGFWHTTAGHAVITVLGGAFGVVAQVCSSGHVTKYAFVSAGLGAVMAWALAFKTQGKDTADNAAALAEANKVDLKNVPPPPPGAGVFLPFFLPVAFVAYASGCAGCAGGSVPTPTPSEYTRALEQCLEQDGIKDATDLGSKIFAILSSGGTQAQMIQQLEALGIPTAGQALELIAICAVEAWTGGNPIQPNNPPTPAQATARVFLARHAKTLNANTPSNTTAVAPTTVSLAFGPTTGKAGTTASISATSTSALRGNLLVANDTQNGQGTSILDIIVNGQSTFPKSLQTAGIPTTTFLHNTFGYGNRLALPLCPAGKSIVVKVKFLRDSHWSGTLSGTEPGAAVLNAR